MRTPLRSALSRTVGWLSDRRIPTPLRAPLFRTYARFTGARLDEVALPLDGYTSFASFFVRRLVSGARTFPEADDVLPSPADGVLQDVARIERGAVLRAKGAEYSLDELLGDAGDAEEFEGGTAWTVYLSPRDYHRVHTPLAARLARTHWVEGARFSVRPNVVAARPRLYVENERCCLRLETPAFPAVLVMVGALNVGRIRVVGVEQGTNGALPEPRELARGAELARFELGSTVVLVVPADTYEPLPELAVGAALAMGQPMGRASGISS